MGKYCKEVEVNLDGTDSNVFYLFGKVVSELMKHNVSKEKNYNEKKDLKKGEQEAYQAMIYNSVIAFSLIDNLQGIRYRFKDHCFFITRERVMQSGQFVLPIQEEEGANCLKENILGQKNIEKLFANLFTKE